MFRDTLHEPSQFIIKALSHVDKILESFIDFSISNFSIEILRNFYPAYCIIIVVIVKFSLILFIFIGAQRNMSKIQLGFCLSPSRAIECIIYRVERRKSIGLKIVDKTRIVMIITSLICGFFFFVSLLKVLKSFWSCSRNFWAASVPVVALPTNAIVRDYSRTSLSFRINFKKLFHFFIFPGRVSKFEFFNFSFCFNFLCFEFNFSHITPGLCT